MMMFMMLAGWLVAERKSTGREIVSRVLRIFYSLFEWRISGHNCACVVCG